LRAEEKLAVHLDVDPVQPHDPKKGQIAQSNFAFLRIDPTKSSFKSDVSLLKILTS
jgi:hypothetical protein